MNCVDLNVNKIEYQTKENTSEIIPGTIVIDEDLEQGTIQFPITLQVISLFSFPEWILTLNLFFFSPVKDN